MYLCYTKETHLTKEEGGGEMIWNWGNGWIEDFERGVESD